MVLCCIQLLIKHRAVALQNGAFGEASCVRPLINVEAYLRIFSNVHLKHIKNYMQLRFQ